VSEPASISAGIAARYASALFEMAGETGTTATLTADIETLDAALTDSADLRGMIASPLLSRDEQEAAIGALAGRLGLAAMTGNTLRLMAQKRRLFVLPQLLAALRAMLAAARGEVTAEVAAAAPLTEAQAGALADTLSARIGKTVKLKTHVDETLIGGLVVKVGSTMIDTSVKAKLAALQNAMKEVG
jgi:F-type H+-transporting ATPase subunit delta